MSYFLKYCVFLVSTISLFLSVNVALFAEEEVLPSYVERVLIKGEKDFPLSATFYQGGHKAPGVLMLHDCAHDSKSYEDLGTLFSQQGLNALAFDFRGFGGSATDDFSQQDLKKTAKNMNDYKEKLLELQSFWDKDVLQAYEYLQSRLLKGQGISVITSGCSAIQGVAIAESYRVNSFAFLSPVMDYMEKERYKNLIDIPSFFISAIHHTDSFRTANELYTWNGDQRSVLLTYKGNQGGYLLLKDKSHLVSAASVWIQKNLHHLQVSIDK